MRGCGWSRCWPAEDAGAAQVVDLLVDVLFHVLLVALGQDDDGLAAGALVGQAALVNHVEHLVAPAQDQGVPALQHLRPPLLQILYLIPDRL